MDAHVIVDIGCMECGENTSVVGVFLARERAEAAFLAAAMARGIEADEHWETVYFTGGQRSLELFTVEVQ